MNQIGLCLAFSAAALASFPKEIHEKPVIARLALSPAQEPRPQQSAAKPRFQDPSGDVKSFSAKNKSDHSSSKQSGEKEPESLSSTLADRVFGGQNVGLGEDEVDYGTQGADLSEGTEAKLQEPLLAKTAAQVALRSDWKLQGTNLETSELDDFFQDREPAGVLFFGENSSVHLQSNKSLGNSSEGKSEAAAGGRSDQYVYVSTDAAVKAVAQERLDRSAATGSSTRPKKQERLEPRLEENAFSVKLFEPGFADNFVDRIVPVISDPLQSLQGPDFSLDNFNVSDREEVIKAVGKVLTLGHEGLVVVEIEGGKLFDEKGFDFAIFENVFRRPPRLGGVFQEFARVGVSSVFDESQVKWFPCDPLNKILEGCAGVVPTDEGGDLFDLSEVGAAEAKFIWIKDTGKNKNKPGTWWPTEGADIDNVRLIHAYQIP